MITTQQMLDRWTRRLAELQLMRPITQVQALAQAEREELLAAECDARIAAAAAAEKEIHWMEAGYVMPVGTCEALSRQALADRARREAQAIHQVRSEVWGESTRALQHRGRAEAFRRIASVPEGTALAASIADAQAKVDYYTRLLEKEKAAR